MTAKQKRFITEKLIPFILRDHGRGFDMHTWRWNERDSWVNVYSNEVVPAPACGTVCCIGGSIGVLIGRHHNPGAAAWELAGAEIGLTEEQSDKLFSTLILWPQPYRNRFLDAKTQLGQAKAACALLREIVRTDGRVLA